MRKQDLLDNIIRDLKRLQRNTETYVINFVKFALNTKPPFSGSYLEWNLDENKFKFLSKPKSPLSAIPIDDYLKSKDKNISVKDKKFIYYPKGKASIIIFDDIEWMIETHNGLKYSNYSEPKKLRKIEEAGKLFYKHYQDAIQIELDHYKAMLENSEDSGSSKLI